jgi:hypothetical protein
MNLPNDMKSARLTRKTRIKKEMRALRVHRQDSTTRACSLVLRPIAKHSNQRAFFIALLPIKALIHYLIGIFPAHGRILKCAPNLTPFGARPRRPVYRPPKLRP